MKLLTSSFGFVLFDGRAAAPTRSQEIAGLNIPIISCDSREGTFLLSSHTKLRAPRPLISTRRHPLRRVSIGTLGYKDGPKYYPYQQRPTLKQIEEDKTRHTRHNATCPSHALSRAKASSRKILKGQANTPLQKPQARLEALQGCSLAMLPLLHLLLLLLLLLFFVQAWAPATRALPLAGPRTRRRASAPKFMPCTPLRRSPLNDSNSSSPEAGDGVGDAEPGGGGGGPGRGPGGPNENKAGGGRVVCDLIGGGFVVGGSVV